MAKDKSKHQSSQQVASNGTKLAENSFEVLLQELLKQEKYRQALEEIKKIRKSNPKIEFTPKESEIWLLRGQKEFQKQDFKQAEKSFVRAIELGLVGAAHYWQAKCLIELNQLDSAFNILRNAFQADKLTQNYSISYLKLLLLKGDITTVEQLINQESQRFTAEQIDWVQGVIALKQAQPEAALASFQKIQHPITPGDLPIAWIIYSQQASGNWSAATNLFASQSTKSDILHRLAISQQAKTGESPLDTNHLQPKSPEIEDALSALKIVQFINNNNPHSAAHLLLQMLQRSTRFSELSNLRKSLFTLAGQQAFNQEKLKCAELFWQPLLSEKPFNSQLAINLLQVLDYNDSHKECLHTLTQFLRWLEQEGKQKPQEWPDTRLKLTLAHLHCWIADTHMALGSERAALASLQQGERICSTSPEVVGRKGLVQAMNDNYSEAIPLLTQAIEGGCRFRQVYKILLLCWRELDNKQAFNEARRRFGKYFGDINIETEVEILPWIDALSTLCYPLFKYMVEEEDSKDPAIYACQIFVNAIQGTPTASGRVSLNQKAATSAWDNLLQKLSGNEQIPVLQAICLSIQLFSKREKGIAALINQYLQKLFNLSTEHPEARITHLVVLAVKENTPKKLEIPLRVYLDTMPQPGNALANIQLQARCFGEIKTLVPALDQALRREPQNPLLLLAKATTYDIEDPKYEQLKQEGFDLARRLQDAKALQAFREEQAFVSSQEANRNLLEEEEFEDLDDEIDISDVDDILSRMLQKLFGSGVPPSQLEKMLPEIRQKLLNSMPDFLDDDDDDDDEDDDEPDIDFIFRDLPSTPKKRKGKKKTGFQELL